MYESQVRPPLIEGQKDYHQVTEDLVRPIEAAPTRAWWIGFLVSVACLIFGIYSVTMQVIYGSANGTFTERLAGAGISPTSSGGSVLVTPER